MKEQYFEIELEPGEKIVLADGYTSCIFIFDGNEWHVLSNVSPPVMTESEHIQKEEMEKMTDLYNDKQTLGNHGITSVVEPGYYINRLVAPTVKSKTPLEQINELLDKTIANKRKEEINPIDSPCNINPKHLGGFTDTIKEPTTLADIPLEDIKINMKIYYNGTVNEGHPCEKRYINHECWITSVYPDSSGAIEARMADGSFLWCSKLENLSFDPIIQSNPHGDTLDMLVKLPENDIIDAEFEDNKWNCKCPICGGEAYRGLSKIECKNGCDC